MSVDFDLGPDGDLHPIRWSKGNRAPTGRRTHAGKTAAQMEADLFGDDAPEDDPDSPMNVRQLQEHAKMRKETALAGLNELELQLKSKQYLPRAAYREATATLLASLAQGLRSLPDILERKFGLQPEVLDVVGAAIDEALTNTADTLALFHGAED